jgi:alpha-L-fucosidase
MSSSPVPSPAQLAWQNLELGMFFHLDMFTFRPGWVFRDDPEAGVPPAEVFNPERLDTDQWIEAAQALGAKYAVLTAQHCSGFCLWPSEAYPYSVRQSPWRGGQGDIVGDFVASCRRAGILPGLYCSFPANWYLRVDSPGRVMSGDPDEQARYAAIYGQQLRELWSWYGELGELWFDGSLLPPDDGGLDIGPLLAELQPNANVFQSPYATIRWVGNEDGVAPDPCWATVAVHNQTGGQEGGGDPEGLTWCPSEVDTTLLYRDSLGGWFWQPGCEDEARMRPVSELLEVYRHSVGRNSNLLLNATPGPDGLIPQAHLRRYEELGRQIVRRYCSPVAQTSGRGAEVVLDLAQPATINGAIMQEDIAQGERVRSYRLEARTVDGAWVVVSEGSCLGHKKIAAFEPVAAVGLRLQCLQSKAEAQILNLAALTEA